MFFMIVENTQSKKATEMKIADETEKVSLIKKEPI